MLPLGTSLHFPPTQVGLVRALWALVVPLARLAFRLAVWCSPLLIWAGENRGHSIRATALQLGAATACGGP